MQQVLGVTGSLGTGKSWLAGEIMSQAALAGEDCVHIAVDSLRRFALDDSKARRHVSLRRRLAEHLGLASGGQFAELSLPCLYRTIFSDPSAREVFSGLVTPVLTADTRRLMRAARGHVVLEWAMLLEEGYGSLVTGPVVIVTCSEEEIAARVEAWEILFSLPFVRGIRSWQPTDTERANTARSLGIPFEIFDTTDRAAAAAAVPGMARRFTSRISAPQACSAGIAL